MRDRYRKSIEAYWWIYAIAEGGILLASWWFLSTHGMENYGMLVTGLLSFAAMFGLAILKFGKMMQIRAKGTNKPVRIEDLQESCFDFASVVMPISVLSLIVGILLAVL